ncbi:MAG: hypothetical protein AAF666_19005 [Pseudomonadota bacterium]
MDDPIYKADGTTPADRLARALHNPARLVRAICLLVLAIGLTITLILKVYMLILTDHTCAADAASLGNLIRCTPVLDLLAATLALSAGFELAFLLLTGSMEQAIRPVILALASGFIAMAGGLTSGSWELALTLVAVAAAMAVLVLVGHWRVKPPKIGGGE